MADYFTRDTDRALEKFINSENMEEKHAIFESDIKPAFEKLIENLIFVYSFFKIDDVDTLKRECLADLYEMIPRFDPSRGTKGFSYFNVVAKNWFIQKTREKNKRNKLESELYYDLDHENVRNDPSLTLSAHDDFLENNEKLMKFYEEMESWRSELKKKPERQVLDAIIFLMKNPELVSIYNKKAVYLYLRELTALSTKQVVVNLKKIKTLYNEWCETYNNTGESG